jgi:hypothetical protein
MRELLALFAHLLVTIAQLMEPGGAKAIVAENLLMKQQLLVPAALASLPLIYRLWIDCCPASGRRS